MVVPGLPQITEQLPTSRALVLSRYYLTTYMGVGVNLDNLTAWRGSLGALLGAIYPEGYPL